VTKEKMLDAFSMGSAWLTVLFNFLQRSSYIKLHPQGCNNPQQSATIRNNPHTVLKVFLL
jgi:hypothetical protein